MVVLRRAGVALIVAVLALGLGGGLAGAKKKHKKRWFATRLTLSHPSDKVFAGRVSSKLRGRRSQRLVTL